MSHEVRSDLTRIADGENHRDPVLFMRWHLSCCFPLCQSSMVIHARAWRFASWNCGVSPRAGRCRIGIAERARC